MTEKKSAAALGRRLLMGVAVGTLPLVGCVPAMDVTGDPAVIEVSAAEKALYERALAARSAEAASRFARTFPSSELIPFLFSTLPASELGRIPASTVEKIDPDVRDDLPRRVKKALGLTQERVISPSNNDSDGYSG